MKDGRQDISFDRWLIRVKDVLQIVITIVGIIYGSYKYLKTVEQKDTLISQQQRELSELRTKIADQ